MPRYLVTRTNGDKYLVVSFEKQPPWYVFTRPNGVKSQQLMEPVESVDEIPPERAREFLARANADREAEAARIAAKLKAKMEAKNPPPPDPPAAVSVAPSTSGVHVGPRGGVYHYSKNGNKVYHKK
jgi:hypothetical protein